MVFNQLNYVLGSSSIQVYSNVEVTEMCHTVLIGLLSFLAPIQEIGFWKVAVPALKDYMRGEMAEDHHFKRTTTNFSSEQTVGVCRATQLRSLKASSAQNAD